MVGDCLRHGGGLRRMRVERRLELAQCLAHRAVLQIAVTPLGVLHVPFELLALEKAADRTAHRAPQDATEIHQHDKRNGDDGDSESDQRERHGAWADRDRLARTPQPRNHGCRASRAREQVRPPSHFPLRGARARVPGMSFALPAAHEVYVGRDVGGRMALASPLDVERYEAGTGDRHPWYHGESPFGGAVAPALLYHSEVYRDLSWY